ncbi:MAG: penicillin-binding protein 2, partial [Deltaproteobacteria bacterium]|nr:penicillin-binding protein 2 [Deltaproteobacteria bacterium]
SVTMLPPPSRTELAPQFRRRIQLVMIAVSVVFFLLAGRLWVLQVLQGERFSYLSKNNRIRIKTIPGIRGMVFDRKGRLLVDSRPSFDLLFVPEDSQDPKLTLRHLARLLGLADGRYLEVLNAKKKRLPFREVVLDRDVDWRTVVAVETHERDLPGVNLRIRPKRSYLNNEINAHLLGYLGEIGPTQLKTLRHEGYGMGDEIGQFGLEKKWEQYLRGRSGKQQVEVDALGRRIKILDQEKDVPGHSVFLTMDADLQKTAYESLKGKEGAVVIMEADTGALLTLVSTPAFDPNAFARGISAEEWNNLLQDRARPLHNKAIQGVYPPGSIFKIIMAIAALEEGIVTPRTPHFCPGFLTVGKRVFRDWKPGGHGVVNLNKALVESCDVYFYQLGQQLGIDRIARYARMMGLGKKTGIALDGEKGGIIPDRNWKFRRFGQPWFPGETPSVAIGQGYVSVTPLQIATFVAAMVNGGTLYRPWFVRKVEAINGSTIEEYVPQKMGSFSFKPGTLQHVNDALKDVVNTPQGTGKEARSDLAEVAGKTGTAQVAGMEGDMIKSEDLPYLIRDHAWFAAYAPAEKPEIVVVVLIQHGGHG